MDVWIKNGIRATRSVMYYTCESLSTVIMLATNFINTIFQVSAGLWGNNSVHKYIYVQKGRGSLLCFTFTVVNW